MFSYQPTYSPATTAMLGCSVLTFSTLLCRLTDCFVAEEFPHLRGQTYLDHAGAGLYSKSQIDGVREELMSRLAGNPHSAPENAAVVEEARNLVLRHFNTDSRHYDVVFTSGATASIKEWLETNSVHITNRSWFLVVSRVVVGPCCRFAPMFDCSSCPTVVGG